MASKSKSHEACHTIHKNKKFMLRDMQTRTKKCSK